ncbi:MAG: hypothetical protein KIT45_13885 [Fimbriimonadia bacterium]|nr:hypothetical protein [Fimbriimonadia bacterium]
MNRQVLALIGLALAITAHADLSFGGSSSRGMGGAGLAIIQNPANDSYHNPAALAFSKGVRFGLGNFDLSADGANVRTILDELKLRPGSAFDIAETAQLLRRFGSQNTKLVAQGDLGLIVQTAGISAGGIIEARLLPNAALQNWARNGNGDLNSSLLNGARGDAIAVAAISLPDFTAGMMIPLENGKLAVGARLRVMKVYYTHYIANENAIRAGSSALRAPEMGGRDYLSKQTTGIDIGIMMKPEAETPVTLALVIENAIEPTAKFDATDVQGNPIQIKPLRRAIHVGLASETDNGTIFALDIIDIGNRTGRSEVRWGAQQKLPGGVSVQAGYASRTGYTTGVGFGGFNIAYSKRLPMQISRTLTF